MVNELWLKVGENVRKKTANILTILVITQQAEVS